MRFDISAYKVGTSCGPSVIHKLDFDNPKVYGDIFDGFGKCWIGEADDSLKTTDLYHVIYEQALNTSNKISLFSGPCFSSCPLLSIHICVSITAAHLLYPRGWIFA